MGEQEEEEEDEEEEEEGGTGHGAVTEKDASAQKQNT